MNRAERRKLKIKKSYRRLKSGEARFKNIKEAREFLRTAVIKRPNGNMPIFPLKMEDGRVVTLETATDFDVMDIVNRLAE